MNKETDEMAMIWENRSRIGVNEALIKRIETALNELNKGMADISARMDMMATRDYVDLKIQNVQNDSKDFSTFTKSIGKEIIKMAIAGGLLYFVLHEGGFTF